MKNIILILLELAVFIIYGVFGIGDFWISLIIFLLVAASTLYELYILDTLTKSKLSFLSIFCTILIVVTNLITLITVIGETIQTIA